jgi:hypothetical protein
MLPKGNNNAMVLIKKAKKKVSKYSSLLPALSRSRYTLMYVYVYICTVHTGNWHYVLKVLKVKSKIMLLKNLLHNSQFTIHIEELPMHRMQNIILSFIST